MLKRDRLCPVLNVMELMTFATDLKIGNKLSNAEKQQLVSDYQFRISIHAVFISTSSSLHFRLRKY